MEPSSSTLVIAAVMLLALNLYFLFGGADFGGGVWDLFASGPRKQQQRDAIVHAIGPVWEANHVWLIFAVVLLFAGFPRAFWAVSIALHVPLTLFLLGIVFRGSAFAFRSAFSAGDRRFRLWGRVFSISSLISPVLLGMSVGALVSGDIRIEGDVVQSGFFSPWLAPFPIAVGLFALALCAWVAATWLAWEAPSVELKEDFRKRALISGVVAGVLAFVAIGLSRSGAPRVFETLIQHPTAWLFHVVTAAGALATLAALYKRRYGWARVLVAAQVTLVLAGWARAQYPWLVVPDLTLAECAGHPVTQKALLWAIALGTPVLAPSLYFLFRIFKSARAQQGGESKG